MKKPIKNLAIVAAAGAAAGYLTGLLTAKKSGKETRADIVDTTNKIKDSTEAKINELTKELVAVIKQAEAKINSSKLGLKSDLSVLTSKAKQTTSKASEVIAAFKSGKAKDKDLNESIESTKAALKRLKNYLK